MALTAPIRAYRIRWRDTDTDTDTDTDADTDADADADREVRATIDHDTRHISLATPGGPPVTVDVVTARAVSMVLSDAVYRTLDPDGPTLSIEADTGHGFTDLRELT